VVKHVLVEIVLILRPRNLDGLTQVGKRFLDRLGMTAVWHRRTTTGPVK
jgi:hypothetical protein